jgi:hypothetical protein
VKGWRGVPWSPLVGALLTVATVALLGWRLLPLGVPGEWEWPWRSEALGSGLGTLAALVIYGLATWQVMAASGKGGVISRRRVVAVVTLCVVAAAVMLVALPWDAPAGPVVITASTVSLSTVAYYSEALLHPRLLPMLRHYVADSTLPTRFPRVRTHPPGPLIYFWLGHKLLAAWPQPTSWLLTHLATAHGLTATDLYLFSRNYAAPVVGLDDMAPALLLGLLVTLGGALLPGAAYLLGRGLAGRREGLVAALLAAAIPSLLVFSPSIEGVAAVGALSGVGLWAQALRWGRWWQYGLAGTVIMGAALWSAGLLVVLLPMAVMLLAASRQASRAVPGAATGEGGEAEESSQEGLAQSENGWLVPWQGAMVALAVAGGGLGLLWLGTGYSFPANFMVINQVQREIMAEWQRSYELWLPMNLYDLLLFMGPLPVVLAGVGAWQLFARRDTGLALNQALVGGTAGMLLLVLLSGTTLGEVGRIWLFMMPLLGWPAVLYLSRLSRPWAEGSLALTAACQLLLALSLYHRLLLVHP